MVVRLTLIDSIARSTGPDVRLRVAWTEYSAVNGIPRITTQRLQTTVDSEGSAVFCGLPPRVPIDVEQAFDDVNGRHLLTFRGETPGPMTLRLPFRFRSR